MPLRVFKALQTVIRKIRQNKEKFQRIPALRSRNAMDKVKSQQNLIKLTELETKTV